MAGYAARVSTKILYNGKDISTDISQYIKSLSYTDELSGEADDINITLEDRDRLWQSEWMPEKGATLDVSIITSYWDLIDGLPKEFHLGLFEIDEITLTSSPNEVSIKGVSVPNATTLRGVEHSRSWEKIELKRVANDIATDAGLTLVYDTDEVIELDRVEQSEESDLAFLYKLCNDNGLALKVYDKQIVIFDEVKYEAADISCIFRRNGYIKPTSENRQSQDNTSDQTSNSTGVQGIMISSRTQETPKEQKVIPIITDHGSYSFGTAIRDVYKTCKVSHQEGDNKQVIEATFTDETKKVGKTLIVHTQVKTPAEALKLAKKELRKKNCEEIKASFNERGDTMYVAGLTCEVEGFGHFDGKYLITKVSHDIGGAYTCGIELRKCLEGY